MIAKTATAAVLVAVAAAPIVRMNVIARRRNKAAAADHIQTVNSINEMMNRMSGTSDVTYVSQ